MEPRDLIEGCTAAFRFGDDLHACDRFQFLPQYSPSNVFHNGHQITGLYLFLHPDAP
jgi:hypothetical protein